MCAAERAIRDVLVLRCLFSARERKEFLIALKTAFGVQELDTNLQAQLLLSHRKISEEISSFPSNGMLTAMWRGAPRPRRQRKSRGQAAAAEALCDSDADPEVEALGGNGTGPQWNATPIGTNTDWYKTWSKLSESEPQYVGLAWTPWAEPSTNSTFGGFSTMSEVMACPGFDAGRLQKEANGHAAAEDSSEAIGHAAAEGAVEIHRLKLLECCMEEALAKAAACERRLAEETQSRKKKAEASPRPRRRRSPVPSRPSWQIAAPSRWRRSWPRSRWSSRRLT